MTHSLLSIQKLVIRYHSIIAVNALSLEIEPGEFVGLIGPNGAGKSSTMRAIVGLQHIDRGSIKVRGWNVETRPVEVRKIVGYVPQDIAVYRYLTGIEWLHFVAKIRGLEDQEMHERAQTLIKLCQLENAQHRLLREYSGGMLRKVALAAALIKPPELLLLDESFVGLDPESTYRIIEYLKQYVERGGSILLSTHILEMLQNICTRVVILNKGQKVADFSSTELQRHREKGRDLIHLYLKATEQEDLLKKVQV